jgi:hypothetical protein
MAHEFEGPQISKKRGGLGRSSNVDPNKVNGIVCGGVTTAAYTTLGTIVKITQLSDAEDLGFNASYDANNSVILWHALKRLFAKDPDAIVYLMVVAQTVTLTQMCDKANPHVYKMVTDEFTNREVKRVGVIRNPASGYTPTYTTGIDADVITTIVKAQELIDDLFSKSIFLNKIYIEGRMDPAGVISTLYNLRAQAADGVGVVIAQDPALSTLNAAYARTADIGSVLGMRSVRQVHESLGSADIIKKPESKKGQETYPLTDKAEGFYLTAQLSSGKKYNELSPTDKQNLRDKGYIYAGKYEGMDGFFFNDGHNCIAVTDDYAYEEDNEVFNKAALLVRQSLLPIMKGTIETDPNTGFLPASQISSYEARAIKKVQSMTIAGEISGTPRVIIAADQDVVGTGTVELELAYVRKGILRVLKAKVGAINPAVSN